MSNHFPSIPGDLELSSIQYEVQGPSDFSVVSGSPFYFTSDVSASVTVASVNAGLGNLSASFTFNFNTPGTFGSFDQDSIETGISDTVTAMCQAIADASGASLASIQAEVTINRGWGWNDASGYFLGFEDTMTYP
jgi:hypothetical protein